MSWLIEHASYITFAGAVIAAIGAVLSQMQSTEQERKMLELTQTTLASVTGGDSYPEVLMLRDEKAGMRRMVVVTNGKYPLYDVEVRILDSMFFDSLLTAKQKEKREVTVNQHRQASRVFKVGTVPPGNVGAPVAEWPLSPTVDRYQYTFTVFARNGTFVQTWETRRVDGRWISAKKIIKPGSTEAQDVTLFEKADPQFPLDADGQIDWDG